MTDSFNRRPIVLAVGVAAFCLLTVGLVQAGDTTYAYDALGRLTAVTRSDGTSVAYAYDEAGNRASVVAAGLVETPDPFELGAFVTGATAGTWRTSAAPVLSGFVSSLGVTVAGGQYRIAGGGWRTEAGTVNSGQSVQVRVQAPVAGGASQTATLTVGGVSDTFQVTTAVDTTPDAFSLGGPSTGPSGAWISSDIITAAGINAATPVTITGGQFRVNGAAWRTAPVTVTAGRTIEVRVQAPATPDASQTATLTIGGITDTFQVTAIAAPDTTPNTFNSGGPIVAGSSLWVPSSIMTVEEINPSPPASVTGGQHHLNGGSWLTTVDAVITGQTTKIRAFSLTLMEGFQIGALTIGGVSDPLLTTPRNQPWSDPRMRMRTTLAGGGTKAGVADSAILRSH